MAGHVVEETDIEGIESYLVHPDDPNGAAGLFLHWFRRGAERKPRPVFSMRPGIWRTWA